MYVMPYRPRRCIRRCALSGVCPERDACALSLSKGTSQRFSKLSPHSLSENRRHSIWVVRGKSDYPKIAT